MGSNQRIMLIVTLVTGFFCYGFAVAEITVEPFGFAVSVEEDGEADVELLLSNSDEVDVVFNIDYSLVEEEDRQAGPRRDDPGDVIERYEIPYNQPLCMAWDPDRNWVWGTHHHEGRLFALDPEDGELQENFEIVTYLTGMFYIDGILYLGGWSQHPQDIYRYDTDGRALGALRSPISLAAAYIASDGEHLFVLRTHQFRDGVIHVYDLDGFDEVAEIDYGDVFDDLEMRAIEWVSDHPRGQLWVSGRDRLYQFYIDDDWNCELLQDFRVVGADYDGLAHDGENLWHGPRGFNIWYVIDDGVREFYMLTIDPEEGVVPGDDSETVNISINPGGYEEGVYNVLLAIELSEPEENRDDLEQTLIEISAVVTVGDPTFNVSGIVTDANENPAIEGAAVSLDDYHFTRFTDEDGVYIIEALPAGEYALTFTATDHLTAHQEINIGNEDVELDVALLQAECVPNRDEFFIYLAIDDEFTFEFTVTNNGNGPLTYHVEKRLADEDAEFEPWEIREEFNAEEITGDNMLNGVVRLWSWFWITGGNNGEDISKVYVLNHNHQLLDEFDQSHESRYGMRDLTWDGDHIWGADENILYGISILFDRVEATIEGQVDRNYRSVAWDDENELFWVADINSDIYAIDHRGEHVRTLQRPDDLQIYGLAYWQDDPDGHSLYVFDRGEDADLSVDKIDLENGNAMHVTELDVGGGRPGGIQITNMFDPYSWVLVALVQNPDRVVIWQLANDYSWFRVEPDEGVIEAEESENFVLTLNNTRLIENWEYEGELVFVHDGIGGETVLSVTLWAEGGIVPGGRELDLHIGWNTVSLNIEPDDRGSIERVMSPLVEEDLLVIMKDGEGHFYMPDWDFDNIFMWHVEKGYQIKMRGGAELWIEGAGILRDRPIELEEGWQLISYFLRFPIEATIALSGIEEHLVIAKDGYGNFYIPDWNFSNMGDMCEGQGYYVNVDSGVNLIYRFERPDDEGALAGMVSHSSVYDEPGQLPVHAVTGVNMSLLVVESTPPFGSPPGNRVGEIGIYADNELVGSGVLQNGVCGIAVWGDDPSTNEIDGALEDQQLEIRLLRNGELIAPDYTVLAGEAVYSTDGFAVVQLTASSAVPVEFGINSAYPNP
ncbi:carboxypeptidase regulatory-like domain-containing protein, partial [bacterium]|nr:carboxypeptidase regulatory-like domain-containing protein [bacterium]